MEIKGIVGVIHNGTYHVFHDSSIRVHRYFTVITNERAGTNFDTFLTENIEWYYARMPKDISWKGIFKPMTLEKKEVVKIMYNDDTYYCFENCNVVEVLDRIVISDKTTEEVVGNFPINRTEWPSSATSTEKK